MKTWIASVLVTLAAGAWAFTRPGSSVGATADNVAVQLVSPGQPQAGNPGEKGGTYYALEGQTARLTTRYRDGHVAVSERGLAGDMTTTVRDRAGNDRARLRVTRIDAARDMLHFAPAGGSPFQALSDPRAVKPTLDWAARQAYGLVLDGSTDLVWDGGSMRPKKAARRNVDGDVDEIETVWANGLVARLTRQTFSRRDIAPGKTVSGRAWVSELTQHGASVGRAVWFEQQQVLAFTLPALMGGLVAIGPADLKSSYGGWPFAADPTWLNLQVIASHQFRATRDSGGSVAKLCEPTKPGRLAQFFMPTLSANEAGCDDFHWLDGSIVRACCDDHDRCYSKGGCGSSSWWRVWTSWTCDMCNIAVVGCFFARGSADPRCIQRGECAG